MSKHDSFDTFFEARQAAASAYVNGDGAPLDALVARAGEGTFHSPGGDTVNGAGQVSERYLADARSFASGSTTHFEVLQKGADGDLGFWTGFQVAKVRLAGHDAPVAMRIRVTEVFRRVDGAWKMVLRHADMGRPPASK